MKDLRERFAAAQIGEVSADSIDAPIVGKDDWHLTGYQDFIKWVFKGQEGLFGYQGWQPVSPGGTVVAPTGETNSKDNKPFYRIGLDASLNYETLNLCAMFLQGADDKGLNALDLTQDYSYTGGFCELDWAGPMNNRLVASLMYNWVRPPSYDDRGNVDAYSALLRYYLGDWSAVNVAIHAEYTFRRTGTTIRIDEHQVALLVDFDF